MLFVPDHRVDNFKLPVIFRVVELIHEHLLVLDPFDARFVPSPGWTVVDCEINFIIFEFLSFIKPKVNRSYQSFVLLNYQFLVFDDTFLKDIGFENRVNCRSLECKSSVHRHIELLGEVYFSIVSIRLYV